jgi:formyltetrahydrofolate deformylase
MKTYILLFRCRDQKGIVAKISQFVLSKNGNMISADQYSTDPENGQLFLRIEFFVPNGLIDLADLEKGFRKIAVSFKAGYKFFNKDNILRMGIFVSKPGHCLFDLLYLWRSGELDVEIPFVASNHDEHRRLVEQFGVPFYYIQSCRNKRCEKELLYLSKEADFLVLARYMLVLSPKFLKSYKGDIINIHHGFLPSFKGPDPYRQALTRGVKIIGATAHFVSEELDAGPIISQAVERVTHKDNLGALKRKGKNLEKRALSDAVLHYVEHRIIRHNNKTIVFEK